MPHDYNIPPVVRSKSLKLDSTLEDILLDCYSDIGMYCELFHPGRFRVHFKPDGTRFPRTKIHQAIIDFVNEHTDWQRKAQAVGKRCGMKLAITGGRGTAKTSHTVHGCASRNITMCEARFQTVITKSLGRTVLHTENLRRDLITNDWFRKLYGSIRPISQDLVSTFGKESWEAWIGEWSSLMMPMGREQEIRGLLHRDERPIRIFMDDFEKREELNNPDLRERNWEYIQGDVRFAVDQFEEENVPYQIWYTDTVKHPLGAMWRIMQDSSWRRLSLPVCDENYDAVDPRFKSNETIQEEIAEARAAGVMDVWVQENMCQPGSRESALVQREDIQYYNEGTEALDERSSLVTFVLVDPARSINPKAAYTGIVVISVDLDRPAVYVRDVVNARLHPDEQVQTAIDLCKRWKADTLGVEMTGLALYAQAPFQSGLEMAGLYHVHLLDLKASSGIEGLSGHDNAKVGRMIPLAGWYRSHLVFHNNACKACMVLEDQLLTAPNNVYWDVVDAAAHVVQAMSKMKLSFSSARIKPAEARMARVLFEGAPESIPSMFDDTDMPEFAADLDTFLENTCGAF